MTLEEAQDIVLAERQRVARIQEAEAVVERERRRLACRRGDHYLLHDPRSADPYCAYCGKPLPERRRRR